MGYTDTNIINTTSLVFNEKAFLLYFAIKFFDVNRTSPHILVYSYLIRNTPKLLLPFSKAKKKFLTHLLGFTTQYKKNFLSMQKADI